MADCNKLIPVEEEKDLFMVDDNAPLLGTSHYGVCWNGGNPFVNGRFYPFRANIVGKVKSTIDPDGNVIVTLKNLRIVPSGTTQSYWTSGKFATPWYGSTSSATPAYRAIAIAVVTSQSVPAEWDPAWHKCLGGWYTAGVNCSAACTTDKWGNAPGGTWGYWMDKEGAGQPFEQTQYQSWSRNVPDQTWNLGKIAPTNGNTTQIWVIAHWQQGVGYNLGCNIGFAGNTYVAGMSFDVPTLNLCPPELETVTQTEDVCNNCVDATLCFEPSDLGGQSDVNLTVEYKYEGQTWSQAMTQITTAYKDTRTCVTLNCLQPQKVVEWRAKYSLKSGYSANSDWVEDKFTSLFVPSIGMIVPDIDEAECVALGQGKYIEHFDKEVGYYG